MFADDSVHNPQQAYSINHEESKFSYIHSNTFS